MKKECERIHGIVECQYGKHQIERFNMDVGGKIEDKEACIECYVKFHANLNNGMPFTKAFYKSLNFKVSE